MEKVKNLIKLSCVLVTILISFVLSLYAQNTPKIDEPEPSQFILAERKRFSETVKFLEENPFSEGAKEKRSWAIKYSDDIETLDCDQITMKFVAPEISGEVLSQYLIKLAAFSLENPESKELKKAQFVAVESAIKVYEITIQKNSKAKSKYLDSLLVSLKKGELEKKLKSIKCSKLQNKI